MIDRMDTSNLTSIRVFMDNNTDENVSNCELLGLAGILVQVLLGVIALAFLIGKTRFH